MRSWRPCTITNFFKPVSAEEHARRCESSQSKSAGTKRPAELPPKRRPGRPRKRHPDTCGRDSPVTAPDGVPITDAETESSEPPAPKIRRRYSFRQKKRVVDYARHHGVRPATRNFALPRQNIQRWMAEFRDANFDSAKVQRTGRRGVNVVGQGRKLSYPEDIDQHGAT